MVSIKYAKSGKSLLAIAALASMVNTLPLAANETAVVNSEESKEGVIGSELVIDSPDSAKDLNAYLEPHPEFAYDTIVYKEDASVEDAPSAQEYNDIYDTEATTEFNADLVEAELEPPMSKDEEKVEEAEIQKLMEGIPVDTQSYNGVNYTPFEDDAKEGKEVNAEFEFRDTDIFLDPNCNISGASINACSKTVALVGVAFFALSMI